ncbi:LytR/AlgR family response regulator transcription factor [Arundinibacter roseus]|uniref:Response regulator transcription factor n=1 Tax=Arundinibacter roseus TaxID=2070510 RepID=A0A4R4JYU0_9BACT|nr:LytTR family DNA-binding domain-containing protein [Arundinibacter roseus]TDB60008.1 response regulator transcription factor [Arundinibacter roseus]
MNILLLEDEPLVARSLILALETLEPDARILGPLDSVQQSLDWFDKNPEPDLILADIQLSDGVSFDIFRQRNIQCPLIFCTAYDAYAVRAFKLNSVDYLLKPIDPDELKRALEKFHRLHTASIPATENPLATLLEQLEQRTVPAYKRRFLANFHRTVVAVAAERVAFFVRDEVIWLVTTDGQRLITDYNSLDELDELLDPTEFFRASRKHTVRKIALEGYRTHYTGKLELVISNCPEEEITVSKEKAAQFRKWFEEE